MTSLHSHGRQIVMSDMLRNTSQGTILLGASGNNNQKLSTEAILFNIIYEIEEH